MPYHVFRGELFGSMRLMLLLSLLVSCIQSFDLGMGTEENIDEGSVDLAMAVRVMVRPRVSGWS